MAVSPSFAGLLNDINNGNTDEVGERIVRRFAGRLVALAATRTGERLSRRVSAEEVVQSVYRTFFRRLGDGLIELRDWESLWGMLARIAVCRICRQVRHDAAAKRCVGRETELTQDVGALDREPEASEVLVASELHDSLVADLPERYRPIVLQILAGATHEEIARTLGTSISTVERVHRRARERLTALLEGET